jgi:hypothetical protein
VTHAHEPDRRRRIVAGFTEAHYAQFMQDWETRINHYLVHGKALPGPR